MAGKVGKSGAVWVFLFVLLLFFFFSVFASGTPSDGSIRADEEDHKTQSFFDSSRLMFTRSWVGKKLGAMVDRGHAYLFPPKINQEGGGGGGMEEKVEEAVVRSLEKTKETVEDSAKSAAEMAEEAVHKTKEKLKKTLSGEEDAHRTEL